MVFCRINPLSKPFKDTLVFLLSYKYLPDVKETGLDVFVILIFIMEIYIISLLPLQF